MYVHTVSAKEETMLRAIIFDFNGVIADDEIPYIACFQIGSRTGFPPRKWHRLSAAPLRRLWLQLEQSHDDQTTKHLVS